MMVTLFLAAMQLSSTAPLMIQPVSPLPPDENCRRTANVPAESWGPLRTIDGRALTGPGDLAALRAEGEVGMIVVNGGTFANADLSGLRLRDICFLETDFAGSDWSGARGDALVFQDVNLSGARLVETRLPNAIFRNTNLDDVDATGASLAGARIVGSTNLSFERLRLDRANLRNLHFDCGIVSGEWCALQTEMSMRGADLTGAVLNKFWFDPDWSGARMDRTRVRPSQLAELGSANVLGPLLVQGGDETVEISAAEHARLLPHLRNIEEAAAPSFDCRRAQSAAEREICAPNSGSLRATDLDVAHLYRLAVARHPAVAAEQRGWLRERDSCAPDCLYLSYERRRGELISRLGPPDWARSGATALFVDPEIWVEDSFRADPLFRRLLPVLIASAHSRVAVRVNADRSIDVSGDAIGGNAHLCDVGGRNLRFDPATGWFSGPFTAQPDDPPEWSRRPMPVLRITNDRAEIYRNGHWSPDDPDDPRPTDYAQCGARAGFSMMVRAPVASSEIERLFADRVD